MRPKLNAMKLIKFFDNNYAEYRWCLIDKNNDCWEGDEEWAHKIANHYKITVPDCECSGEKAV